MPSGSSKNFGSLKNYPISQLKLEEATGHNILVLLMLTIFYISTSLC